MNNRSDGSPDEFNSNKFFDQNIGSKIKNIQKNTENDPSSSLQNGTTSHNEKFIRNQSSASCSFLMSLSTSSLASSSSSSSCLNQISLDKQNGEYSGEKCSAKGRTLSSEETDLRSHDKKQKTGCCIDSESSSGNEGEGFSGDDCCIYTYKGDQFADLPNSFFSVDLVVNGVHQAVKENFRKANLKREIEDQDRSNLGSSPEMDYLEMDFDPGPSVEQDSEEDINDFERKLNDSPIPKLPTEGFTNDNNEKKINKLTVEADSLQDNMEFQPGPSNKSLFQCHIKKPNKISDCNSNNSFNRTKDFLSSCCAGFCAVEGNGQNCYVNQGINDVKLKSEVKKVNSKTCLNLPGERLNKKAISTEVNFGASTNSKVEADSKISFEGIMLWSEQEAVFKQVTLTSSEVSCAATAIINAMLVLKIRISTEKVKQGISSRLKTESAPIPQYLVSRSYAGIAHENLIRGIHHASQGLLYAKYFQMYPKRDVILSKWLVHWMKKGAVPIATMNIQRDSTSEDHMLDIRHHQMIFGVNNKGIFLTNPLECLQEEELWNRLVNPSVLKIKRGEIMSRWTPDSNLKPLMFQIDERWKEMNVLGQVVNIIRESSDPSAQGKALTQHVLIPASSGITLVIPRHSPAYEELASTADLPLFSNSKSE